jgi:N-acetylglucosaminyldiphosphoundecaprenol N-acetyl-beta-D-mannosaminyltransferase
VLGRAYYQGGEARLLAWLLRRERMPRVVHVANVHTAISSIWDAELSCSQDEADLSLADGRPLSLAGKLLGCWNAEQLRGPDLMLSAALQGRASRTRHFYFGGAPGVAAATAAKIKALAPGIQVAGHASPPFRALSDAEVKALIQRLKRTRTDILWVGLGAPKQEKLMARLARLGAPFTMLGVGAGFDYFGGCKREAPKWMQRAALEWVFRLASEPGRLWRRYLSTNAPFLLLLALEYAGMHPQSRQAIWTRGLRVASLAAALWSAPRSPLLALATLALPLLWGRLAWLSGAQR